ncbi:Cysteine protease [Phytophthora megakarya]|uniref:Cysteine protease n=1 Tax=Phytophthora megakarya TaxID=4795 RepID=A0A225VDV8_9STRA|nr:Cysteine protease [Phytophthora megakarya]
MFDPMQKNENYEDMEAKIVELLPTKARQLSFKRVVSPKQEDISNCGLYCLVFFECHVRGIPMPKMTTTTLGYLRFRYLYKACLGSMDFESE